LLANGAVVVVDVRNEQSYRAGHIPGAKLIPVENVIAQSKTLPRNKLIVTYCS
jgi:rhodanese-related sulfurtransferase